MYGESHENYDLYYFIVFLLSPRHKNRQKNRGITWWRHPSVYLFVCLSFETRTCWALACLTQQC